MKVVWIWLGFGMVLRKNWLCFGFSVDFSAFKELCAVSNLSTEKFFFCAVQQKQKTVLGSSLLCN
jgi:hypothetical protein